MPTMPCLHFPGDCATALAFYQTVFDGTNLQMMRYADSPAAPPEWKASPRVMHGQVTIGDDPAAMTHRLTDLGLTVQTSHLSNDSL